MIRNTYILKTTSLLLSFWMLCASAGLSVDFHYCEGELVDWSIIGEELQCDHDKEETKQLDACCESSEKMSCNENDMAHEEGNCCSSDEAQVVIENEFKLSAEETNPFAPLLILMPFFLKKEAVETSKESFFSQEKEPFVPINRRLAVLETFLI